jgi:uncharacterized protein
MAAVAKPRTPALLVGRTRHRRHRPTARTFALKTFTALVNVDELHTLDQTVRGFSYGTFNLTGLSNTDHLGGDDKPLRDKLAGLLASHQVTLPNGPVLLLANLRNVGYVFDPVSWWFCYHEDNTLAFIVAEVHNTFGEQHLYLLDTFTHTASGQLRATATKAFHVSPFLPVSPLNYTFTFLITPHELAAHIDVDDDHGRIFDATQYGTLIPFTTRTLWHTIIFHPLMTFRTIVRIHREALVLFARRVPFHRKPAPPAKDLT